MHTMQALQIWITYHDYTQIEDYELAEDDVFRLFKGNDTCLKSIKQRLGYYD